MSFKEWLQKRRLNRKIKKAIRRTKQIPLWFRITSLVIQSIATGIIAYFAIQSHYTSEKLKEINKMSLEIQDTSTKASIMPQLFVKDIHLKPHATRINDTLVNLDSIEINYQLLNPTNNSALSIAEIIPAISKNSTFFIDTIVSGDPTLFVTLPPQNDKEYNRIATLLGKGTIEYNEKEPFYIHFYFKYRDILDFEHSSYFIYKVKWEADPVWFITNNMEVNSRIN
jgi:hypothetical protein